MEHLREYQDYVLAYRLRALVGGRLRPRGALLPLPAYAGLRLQRQALAREVTASGDYRAALRDVDRLTDELNFGFWHNPGETVAVLTAVVAAGGCAALESEEAFVDGVLTASERARAGTVGCAVLGRYYLGLVRASAAYLDPEAFDRLRGALDGLRAGVPVVVVGGDAVAADEG